MHLIAELTTDLATTVHLGALAISAQTPLMSLVTIVAVMVALTLPFPRGDGAIATSRVTVPADRSRPR